MKIKLAAALLSLATVTGVQAQDGLYAGGQLSRTTYSEDGFGEVSPTAFGARVGMSVNKNFSVEARLSTGLSDDVLEDTIVGPVAIEIDSLAGIYAKGILPLSEKVSLYGLAGYTRAKLTAEAQGVTVSSSESDLSLGVGAEFAMPDGTALSLEYAQLVKGDGFKLTGLTVGLSFKF
jgi:hypothetical protein